MLTTCPARGRQPLVHCWWALVGLLVTIVTLVLASAAISTGATYYVTPAGSDFNPGTSADLPWRTIAHVNQADLLPGDVVLFAGGQTWTESLAPKATGTRKQRLVFGTYGEGRPALAGGVFLRNSRWLEFSGFSIQGVSQGILSGRAGQGSRGIVLRDLLIADVGIAINSANAGDRGWRVLGNEIARTGDSAIIVNGRNFVVTSNSITNAGISPEIPYGKHGIYAKGARITVEHNTIVGASDSGISTRFPDALIQWNQVSQAPLGIGYFQNASRDGVSVLRHNTIWNVSSGIFLADSDVESFVLHGNVITAAANGIQVKKVAGLRAWDNVVEATTPLLLATRSLGRPPAGYADRSAPALAALERLKLRGVGSKSGPRFATTMSCSADAVEHCSISLLVELGKKRIGRATATLAPGQRHVLQIPLIRVDVAVAAAARRLRVLSVVIVTRDANGTVTRTHATERARL